MKKIKLLCFGICICNQTLGQGGWILDTNPLNDITSYTTIFPYTGASFIDINNDNYVDLFAAPKTLFVNNGDGTFSLTESLNYTPLNATSASSCADLDNDGDNDIIVACVPSKIFFNNGDGIFSDSSSQVPSFSLYGSWAVAIGDYNEDRELDFIFAHANGYHLPSIPSACKFYAQQAESFDPLSISGYPFTTDLSTYTNPYWSDYDLDGDMDLFIASGPVIYAGIDPCYKNMKIETGNDTLIQMTTELFATQTQDGQCYNFIDYDNDQDLDLCITSWASAPTRMYKNNGGGNYANVITPFTNTTINLANCWGDYDNDGDVDVIITNGDLPTKYYRNNGNASFSFLSTGFSTPTGTCGITNADYDNDGDLDLFTNGVGNSGNTSSVGLYINDDVAGDRNFVNLKLEGVASNRSAIGAIVRLKATINGNPVWQMREVNAQNSFQGQNDLRVHFGLGDAATIDSLIITWPIGGVESYLNIAANGFYQVEEGVGITSVNVGISEIVTEQHFSIYPDPVSNFLQLILEPYNHNTLLHYEIINLNGQVVQRELLQSVTTTINVTALSSGCYFLKVSGNNYPMVKKFIKQ